MTTSPPARGRGGILVRPLIAIAAVAVGVGLAAPAAAADDPGITVGDDTVSVRVLPQTDAPWFWSPTSYDYTARVFVTNESEAAAAITLQLTRDDGTVIDLGAAQQLAPGEATYLTGRARDVDSSLRAGSMLEVSDGTTVVAVATDTDILPNGTHYWWAIGAACAAAAILVGLLAIRHHAKQGVAVSATWTFSDSWATNLTVVGGTLTTILAATGMLQALAPNVSDGRIVALNLTFVSFALFAPMVYLACSNRVQSTVDGTTQYAVVGSKTGFLLAAAITTAAVLGQLAIIGLLLTEFDTTMATKVCLWLLLAVGVAAIIGYVVATTATTLLAAPGAPGTESSSALL